MRGVWSNTSCPERIGHKVFHATFRVTRQAVLGEEIKYVGTFIRTVRRGTPSSTYVALVVVDEPRFV